MTVQKIDGDMLLIKEIVCWVYAKDCTLVSSAVTVTPKQSATVLKATYDAVVKEKAALAAQVAALIAERDSYKGKLAQSKSLAAQIGKL